MIRTNFKGYRIVATDKADLENKIRKISRGDTNGFAKVTEVHHTSSANGEPLYSPAVVVKQSMEEQKSKQIELMAEAKKRGLVEGARFIGFDGKEYTIRRMYHEWASSYSSMLDAMHFMVESTGSRQARKVYEEGKWVELITEQ